MDNLFQIKSLNTGRAHAGVSDYNRDICLSPSQPQLQLDQADAHCHHRLDHGMILRTTSLALKGCACTL